MKTLIIILFNFISICYSQVLLKQENDSKNNDGFYLYDTYKNPYGCVNYAEFHIPTRCNVSICIFSLDSNLNINYNNCDTVTTLYEDSLDSGFYKIEWDFKNRYKNTVENGFYLFYLRAVYIKNNYQMEFIGQTMIVVLR